MNSVRVVHSRVFAATSGGGNPCPVVVEGAGLSDEAMLGLARHYGLDTVFVLPPQRDGDVRMRYFVPDHELGVSGHATIAGITVATNGKVWPARPMRVETIDGVFEVTTAASERGPRITLEQLPPVFGETVDGGDVARVLNIGTDGIANHRSPIQSVSVSRAKLIVPIVDWRVLNAMKPDYDALWSLCESIGVTGLYPFTAHTDKVDSDVEARQFPLRAGFPEDAATGIAAAALGAYLARYDLGLAPGRHHFRVAQGYAMGAPSSIHVLVENRDGTIARTAIEGSAQLISEEHVVI